MAPIDPALMHQPRAGQRPESKRCVSSYRDRLIEITAAAATAFLRRLLPERTTDGLDPSIYGYILHYSLREQIYLVVVTLFSFPFLYYSLDLPKVIVNRAISGKEFPQNFFGLELDQIRTSSCYALYSSPWF